MPKNPKSAATAARKAPRQARSRDTVETLLGATARVLKRHGYAGTNTNRVAETAGVSIGSLYQYFPNKESLVAALHQRHAEELLSVLDAALADASHHALDATVKALIHATLEAHLVDPDLHRVLEGEVPDLDRFPASEAIERAVAARVRALLARHRSAIAPRDLDLATLVVLRIVESLVHVAVVEPGAPVGAAALEREITRAVLGYLGRGAA
jgi:AcrR family transcriptional regulator